MQLIALEQIKVRLTFAIEKRSSRIEKEQSMIPLGQILNHHVGLVHDRP